MSYPRIIEATERNSPEHLKHVQRTVAKEAADRWEKGTFLERSVPIPPERYSLPWVEYEGYMQAQLILTIGGRPGKLYVRFPPHAAEDNRLHYHPISDRVITVLEGDAAVFVAEIHGKVCSFHLAAGDRIWMPRGTLHTFRAGKTELLVESWHNPFVPLDDPQALTYPPDLS
jgi:hypothetical protein